MYTSLCGKSMNNFEENNFFSILNSNGGEMTFQAFAKINIGLRVLGKRPDGFHNIETLFQQISLYDELDIDAATDGRIHIECSDKACPADETNLAYRAAALLRENTGDPKLGCRLKISKRIPMGGGLGGGSSNAATTLTALNKIWRCGFSGAEIAEMGAALGSDVAFFLLGGLALGAGRGEILQPIKITIPYYGVLICPGVRISTPWVYKNLNLSLTNNNKIGKFIDFVAELDDISTWATHFPNELEKVVFKKYKSFRDIIDGLYDAGAFYARMSGSGSTLFGLFDAKSKAEKAKLHFQKRHQTILFEPIYR